MFRSLAVRAARRVSAGLDIGSLSAPGGPVLTAPLPTAPQGSALAAQQQRGFADAAVATQATIWDELSDLVVTDEGKRELAALRSTYVDISQKLASLAKVGSRGGRRPALGWRPAAAAASAPPPPACRRGALKSRAVPCCRRLLLRRSRPPSTGTCGARRWTPSWCSSSSRRTRVRAAAAGRRRLLAPALLAGCVSCRTSLYMLCMRSSCWRRRPLS